MELLGVYPPPYALRKDLLCEEKGDTEQEPLEVSSATSHNIQTKAAVMWHLRLEMQNF